MRRSDWTPSIVPRDDDQNVYLVVDDLGRLGGVWREAEAEVEATDLEPSSSICWTDNTKIRSASLASIPPRNGRKTFRPRSPRNCASAAICSCATFPFSCKTSSTDTKAAFATSSCRCRSACSEPWHRSAKSPRRSASRMPLPGFIEPAPAIRNRESAAIDPGNEFYLAVKPPESQSNLHSSTRRIANKRLAQGRQNSQPASRHAKRPPTETALQSHAVMQNEQGHRYRDRRGKRRYDHIKRLPVFSAMRFAPMHRRLQVRKNKNQMPAKMTTASPRLTTKSMRTDGPRSA
jgi:hypothetical protein